MELRHMVTGRAIAERRAQEFLSEEVWKDALTLSREYPFIVSPQGRPGIVLHDRENSLYLLTRSARVVRINKYDAHPSVCYEDRLSLLNGLRKHALENLNPSD